MGLLKIRFYIDDETGEPHIYRHGINEQDVEDVLNKPVEDRPGKDGSRVALGQTMSGRYLRIIYVPDPYKNSVFVITAYDLIGKPLKAHIRRRRKKGWKK
jgi:hypothetical protein